MSRTVPADIVTALSQPNVSPFYAVEMLLDDADGKAYDQAGYVGDRVLRFWTGMGDRTIGGETYMGAGHIMDISGLEEVADMTAKSASVTFTNVPQNIISLALSEPYQHRKVRILFGVVDVDDAVEVFAGSIDEMPIEDNSDTGSIRMTIESTWVRLDRPIIRRYTSESQKSRYPTDTFFDWVSDLQDKETLWGRTSD